ncbi:rac GTPase-activating protein 1-like [Diorhabda carinulata]|uniref:rac GTPase-activating protein 1-like n=1 Tax=Diorhabda carinulata TaxID=1163345 RepID=UPI0025A16497|nr:rac GTPase-activating protein 1-like [Diorhabda carinulata]
MCDSPSKPLYRNQKTQVINAETETSDSSSTKSDQGWRYLTIVALYDELIRLYQYQVEDRRMLQDGFYNFAEQTFLLYEEWRKTITERDGLRSEIDKKIDEINDYNRRLKSARKLLDDETRKRKTAENERDLLRHQIAKFCNSLVRDGRNKLADDTKEQISSIYPGRISFSDAERLSAIKEVNSTGSMLSDFSYSRSEDDLDSSRVNKGWKSLQSDVVEEPLSKKRRSSTKIVEIGSKDTVRATTTLTVNKDGPITATSKIESIPKSDGECIDPPKLVLESWNQQKRKVGNPQRDVGGNYRQHYLQQKTIVMPNFCSVCEKHIRFGKTAYKCKECKLFFHAECKDMLPTPCIPVVNTPTSKKFTGILSDYTPIRSPMVPSLIVHCVNEIESRGLTEMGIYRIPGSEKEVKDLKDKFLTCRIPPNLKEIDIHVICGCIKDFLRSLTEPLLTHTLWYDFITAVRAKDLNDITPALYETISKLPHPNRDTLAFIMLHLQKIAQSPECKMPAENLSKVFGPTIVGYSCDYHKPNRLIEETKYIIKVMSHLLNIPSDFWTNFINVCLTPSTNRLQQTPSTDSLLRPTTTRSFTPGKLRKKKEGKLFGTPPAYQ